VEEVVVGEVKTEIIIKQEQDMVMIKAVAMVVEIFHQQIVFSCDLTKLIPQHL
jgi:hypothetical protein